MNKSIVVETIGTFFLALAVFLSGNPIAIGLMLMAMVYMGGHISGGHFNPAVSLACSLYGTISYMTAFAYMFAQLLGGAAAVGICYVLTKTIITIPVHAELSLAQAMIPEALFTTVLCLSVLTMTVVNRYKQNGLAGLVIGLTLTAIASIGGIFNPALVVGGYIGNPIVYVVGPFIGSLLAFFIFTQINCKKVPN